MGVHPGWLILKSRQFVDTGLPPPNPSPLEFEELPSISGLAVVGQTLTGHIGVVLGSPTGYTYRWLADGAAVPGATELTFVLTAAQEDQLIEFEVNAYKGAFNLIGTSAPVGPVSLTFPSFAPPYFLAPASAGSGDGSSFANAAPWTQLNSFATAVFNAGGGIINLASHLGTYTATTVTLSKGGTITTPCIIRGVNASLVATNITIQGTRGRPWVLGLANGSEVFKFIAGANYLTFRNIIGKDIGNGLFRVGADINDLLIEDCPPDNVQRFFEDNISSPATTASITNLTIRRCPITGFSKTGAIRVRYDSSNILIEGTDTNNRMILDSQLQLGDNFPVGIQFNDTAHDFIVRYVNVLNCNNGDGGDVGAFANGDGITSEVGNYNGEIHDCHMEHCVDGGLDMKGGPHTITDVTVSDCGWNFKIWNNAYLLRCKSRDPNRFSGSGGEHHFRLQLNHADGVTLEDCSAVDINPDCSVLKLDGLGSTPPGTLTLINTKRVTAGTDIENDFGATIVGSLGDGPANTVVPTYSGPGSPAIGQVLTSGNGTWTGASTFARQHLRDGAYIQGETGATYTRTADDIGVLNTVEVYGISADGLHEGVVESAAAESIFSIVLSNDSLLEGSAAGTSVGAFSISGGITADWTFNLTAGNAGNRLAVDGVDTSLLEAGAVATVFATSDEHDITVTAEHATFPDVVQVFTILIDKSFDSTYRMISATPLGTQSGDSWPNAAPLSALNTLIGQLAGIDGKILIREGNYTQTSLISITNSGSALHPIEIYGSDRGGVASGIMPGQLTFNQTPGLTPAQRTASIDFDGYDQDSYLARITGNRTSWIPPAMQTGPLGAGVDVTNVSNFAGNSLFNIQSNVGQLNFHHLRFERIGRAVFLFQGTNNDGVTITDFFALNVGDFVHQATAPVSSEVLSNFTSKRGKIDGIATHGFRIRGDSSNILLEDVWMDGHRQDRANYAKGAFFGSTAHGIVCRRVLGNNFYSSVGGYWQGEGFLTDAGVSGLELEDCGASGNTDAGYDIKAPGTIWTRCWAWDNKLGLKQWQTGLLFTDCGAHDSIKLGGSGSAALICGPPEGPDLDALLNGMTLYGTGEPIQLDNKDQELEFDDAVITASGPLVSFGTLGLATIRGLVNGVSTDDPYTVPTYITTFDKDTTTNQAVLAWPEITKEDSIALCCTTISSDDVTQTFRQDGWVEIGRDIQGGLTYILHWRRLAGLMAGQFATFFVPTTAAVLTRVIVYGGCAKTGDPFEAFASSKTTSGTITTPATTTLGSNRMVLSLFGIEGHSSFGTTPAGWTNRAASMSSSHTSIVDEKLVAVAGVEAATSRTTGTNRQIAFRLALLPV